MMTDGSDMTMTAAPATRQVPVLAPESAPESAPEFGAASSLSSSGGNSPCHSGISSETRYDAFATPDGGRAARFRSLRRDVAGIEGRSGAARLPLGVESLDSALAGGLAPGRVHLLCGRPGHDGALTGFTVALLRRVLAHPDASRADDSAPVVWCPAAAAGASGMLCAAGLAALGVDPGRLLIVDSPSPGQRLAALEDILRTSGLAAVILEYDGAVQSGDYWMRLARRAQLAAEASGVTGFLTGWPVAASGFETQWRVAPAINPAINPVLNPIPNPARSPAMQHHSGSSPGPSAWSPCWQVELLQARGGRPHATRLCWQAQDNRFRDLGPADGLVDGLADGLADSGSGGVAGTAAPQLPFTGGGLPRRIVGRRQAATSVLPLRLAGNLAGNLAS